MNDAPTFPAQSPCGPSLEYDADYAMLLSRLQPRDNAQYGDFVSVPEPVNWAEVERACRHLLARSRDINVHIWLCRARTHLAEAPGLAQSLSRLVQDLHAWPEAIHPQLVIEGDLDPMVRANALASLADPEGLAGDVRGIAVVSGTALRLTVRDVERAFSVPRPPDALRPESVRRQMADQLAAGGEDCSVSWLALAARSVRDIDAWCQAWLGADAPSLTGIIRLLEPFALAVQPEPASQTLGERAPVGRERLVSSSRHDGSEARGADAGATVGRHDVLQSIRAARAWFETHEPSSPVAVLLLQAERMVGKRFSQVADSIPLDLLRRWDAHGDDGSDELAK